MEISPLYNERVLLVHWCDFRTASSFGGGDSLTRCCFERWFLVHVYTRISTTQGKKHGEWNGEERKEACEFKLVRGFLTKNSELLSSIISGQISK